MKNYKKTSRRDFLKLVGSVGASGIIAPMSINLATIGKVAAAGADDYKALVCIFLLGGNDHNNLIIPSDAKNHELYKNIRPEIAIERDTLNQTKLNPLNSLPSNELELALNPSMTALTELFSQQKLATLFNVGNLYTPTSMDQFKNKSVPLPPSLFSHNDQQSVWQSFEAEGSTAGWGGKVLDVLEDKNSNSLFNSISMRGNHVFLSGGTGRPYQMGSNGGLPIYGAREGDSLFVSKKCSENFRKILMQNSDNIIANEYRNIVGRAIDAESIVREGFENIDQSQLDEIDQHFVGKDSLSKQLKLVAKLIASRKHLGDNKRQVFMVSMGGFDTHANLLTRHKTLLQTLSDAMAGFYKATETLNVADAVTSFTASDFGRTFTSNGDGSDHGWGAHHFVMGGAVNGGRTYGDIPEYALKTSVDTGRGRLLPTTSVGSYVATLAQWFGVQPSELDYISPYIRNFDNLDLGFMRQS